MNCRESWYKVYHLTSNLLPHYLAKFELHCCSFILASVMYVEVSIVQDDELGGICVQLIYL